MTATLLNARDCGATGDGTTDDAASINSALTTLGTAGGGTLLLPPGVYMVSTALLLPDYVTLAGAGPRATTIKCVASTTGTTIIQNADGASGNDYIGITGLTIDGNLSNIPTKDDSVFGIYFRACIATRISDVEVKSVNGDGLYLSGQGNVSAAPHFLHALHTHDNHRTGLMVTFAHRRSVVSDVVSEGNGGYGVEFDVSQVTAVNITARYNNLHGIWIRNVVGGSYTNLVAELNLNHGILAGGLVGVVGAAWRAQHNGTATNNTWDDVHFSLNDDQATGYGENDGVVIAGVVTGESPVLASSYFGTPTAVKTRYGLYVADGALETGDAGSGDPVGMRIEGHLSKDCVTGTVRRPAGSTTLWINGANS